MAGYIVGNTAQMCALGMRYLSVYSFTNGF